MLWVAGFDMIYACQDFDFDVKMRLRSVPARFGVAGALRLAAACHFGAVVLLFLLPTVYDGFGWIYLAGVAAIAVLLAYEHWLVRPDDLSRVNQAFFHVNAVVSLGLLAVGVVDLTGWRGDRTCLADSAADTIMSVKPEFAKRSNRANVSRRPTASLSSRRRLIFMPWASWPTPCGAAEWRRGVLQSQSAHQSYERLHLSLRAVCLQPRRGRPGGLRDDRRRDSRARRRQPTRAAPNCTSSAACIRRRRSTGISASSARCTRRFRDCI